MLNPATPTRLSVLLPANLEDWHFTISRLLEPQGIQTVAARSGREALRIVESGSVHVCVLDNDMPQLGGMQVIRRMADLATRPPTILLADRLNNHLSFSRTWLFALVNIAAKTLNLMQMNLATGKAFLFHAPIAEWKRFYSTRRTKIKP